MTIKRVAGDVERHIIGQLNWQVLFFLGHHTARVAVHYGNWTAPITLTGQAPITQTEFRDTLANAIGFTKINRSVDCIGTRGRCLPVKGRDPMHHIGFGWHEGFGQSGVAVLGWQKCGKDQQIVFLGKIEIPLIVCRTAKDCACAVVHQDKVGDINWQFPSGIERVAHAKARIKAALFGLLKRLFGRATLAAFVVKRGQFGVALL